MASQLFYEPFAGSGTTLIAAETLRRRCFALEIEPRYVQVAIERWQAFTPARAGTRSRSRRWRPTAYFPAEVI